MGIEVGSLEVVLGLEGSKFLEGLSNADKAMTGFVVGVVELGKKAIEAAAEAQQAASQVAGIFGALAPEVNDFAERLGAAAGRATSDIQGMIGHFGGMLAPMVKSKETAAQMSEGLTSMATSMEKAFHVDSATAVGALTSALAGSARAARQYGIDLSESAVKSQMLKDGLSGQASELNSAQRSMVMYQLVMAQSADMAKRAAAANGDYSEQMKQLDAATKEAAEKFGADLLPAASKVLEVFAGLASTFANLSPGMRETIEVAGGLVAGIGLLSAATALWNSQLAAAAVEALVAFGEAAIAAAPLVLIIGGVVLAVGALYHAWETNMGGIRDVVAAAVGAVQQAFASAFEWISKAGDTLWSGLKDGVAYFRDAIFAMLEGVMGAWGKAFEFIGKTMHQDWAVHVSESVSSAVGGMEGARQGMTASNMGGAISAAFAPIGSTLTSMGQAVIATGKDSLQGLRDLGDRLLQGLTGNSHASGPSVAGLTAAQIAAAAGPGKALANMSETGGTRLGGGEDMGKAALLVQGALEGLKSAQGRGAGADWEGFDQKAPTLQTVAYEHLVQDSIDQTGSDIAAIMAQLPKRLTKDVEKINMDWSGLATKLGDSLAGSLGTLGTTIQAAIQGGNVAGPIGAIAMAATTLLMQSQGFQQTMNVVTTIVSMLANTLGQMMQPVSTLLGMVQNVLLPVLAALTPIFQALSNAIMGPLEEVISGLAPVFTALQTVFTALQKPLEAIFSVVGTVLTPILNALQPVFNAIGQAFSALAPILNALSPIISLVGQAFTAMQPVWIAIGLALGGVAFVIEAIVLGVEMAWNAILTAVSGLLNAVGAKSAAASVAASEINTTGTENSMTQIADGMSALLNGTTTLTTVTDAQTVAAAALTEQMDQATASLTNLPSGYRIALQEFQNMNIQSQSPGNSQAAAIAGSAGAPIVLASGGSVTKTGLAFIHAGEMVVPPGAAGSATSAEAGPLPSTSGGGGGGGAGSMSVVIQIVSNNPETVGAAVERHLKRINMARFGRPMPGANRFALPNDTR